MENKDVALNVLCDMLFGRFQAVFFKPPSAKQ